MSWSDLPFPYGPFVPHWVPRQNIENYFTHHKIDSLLVLNTTVEDVSPSLKDSSGTESSSGWTLTLRRFDPVAQLDVWWKEEFDAVIITNGHLNIPYVCKPNSSITEIMGNLDETGGAITDMSSDSTCQWPGSLYGRTP